MSPGSDAALARRVGDDRVDRFTVSGYIVPCRAVVNCLRGARQTERSILRPEPLVVCFDWINCGWHAICDSKPIMLKGDSHNHDASIEPAPSFASEADIALAQQLRRQLEERYFGSSAEHAGLEPRSDVH
jgi:hypothetical protein